MADLDKQIEAIERDIEHRERVIEQMRQMVNLPAGAIPGEVLAEIESEEADLGEMRGVLSTMRRVRLMAPYLAEPD